MAKKEKKSRNRSLDPQNKLSAMKAFTLPEIDLYMDQLTTFMEDKLKDERRYPEDKILTKTMINNYTKNHLLPPPVKKKYSQDHLITLLYTYYLKNIVSIGDITTLLHPMVEEYWDNFRVEDHEGFSMKDIYERILALGPDMVEDYQEDIRKRLDVAMNTFSGEEDLPEDKQAYLQRFTFCLLLALDVYMKKQMIESIIDDMRESDPE